MFLNSLLLLVFLLLSIIIFFINNLLIILIIFFICIILIIILKTKLVFYTSFIVILIINFLLNYLLSDIESAMLVTLRLIIMFLLVNILIKKIGIYHLAEILGKVFRSKTIFLIVSISLNFIPLMIKEIREIKNSLIVKNYEINIKNVLLKPDVLVITFFTNLLKRINEMEKVLTSRGIDD